MKVDTLRFYILVAVVCFAMIFQVFVPVKVDARNSRGPSKPIDGARFKHTEAHNPVLFAAMAAIERNLNGVPELQKTQFDRIVDSALLKYPKVSRDSLRKVVSTWKQLPLEIKEAIDFPALLAISFDNLQPTNEQNQTDPPILFAVNPKILIPGQTQEVTLVGRNFTPDMKIQFGEGIQIARGARKMVGSYQMTLSVTVAANASMSDRQISVSNSFGTVKRPLTVSLKKQAFIPSKFVSGWGFQKFNNQTELLTWNGMPADGSTEFPFIYGKTGKMVPINSLNWHLKWTNNLQKATQAQWQVSVYPITQDMKNWRNPPGLIAFGLVKSAPATGESKRLDINFAPVVKRSPGSNPYSADAINLKRPDEIVIKPEVRIPPIKQDRTVVKPDQTTIKPPVVTTRKPPVGGQINTQRLKPQIRPSALVNIGKRTFYARLVPLDAKGNIAGPPSSTVEIAYDPNPPKGQEIKFATTETVTCRSPQARIKGYEPIRQRRTDSQYWFLVVSPPPQIVTSAFGWKLGDHLFLPPQEDSKDFWDYVGDAIGGVIDFVANVVNLISAAWNEIKGAVVGAFVSFLKGVQIGCPEWCETGLKMGLDAGLVAIGIPPNIPNFNELQNMGADYLAETIAAEVLAASPVPLPKEEIKKAAKAALTEMTKQVNQTASGGSWLMHDNTADPRPAFLTIQVFNPTNTATDPGYAYVSESYRVFNLNKNVAVPALQPGETVDIPVFLEPDLDLPDGIPTSYIQEEGWWNRYAMQANFSFGAGCGCPEATPPGYDLTNPSQHIILCDPQGGNSDKLSVKAMETWGNP